MWWKVETTSQYFNSQYFKSLTITSIFANFLTELWLKGQEVLIPKEILGVEVDLVEEEGVETTQWEGVLEEIEEDIQILGELFSIQW